MGFSSRYQRTVQKAQWREHNSQRGGMNRAIRSRTMNAKRVLPLIAFALASVAWAHDDDASKAKAPLQLGKVSFPTTCNPSVQPTFERGVALLHSFWFEE